MDPLTVRTESTVLLVVDIQERLLPAMPAPDARRLLASVDLLLEAARLLGVPTLATEQYPRGLGPTVASVREHLARFDPPVAPVEKSAFSALDATATARALGAAGARSVVVVGMEAHVCVFQTARDLRARGYFVHVPFDAVCSREPAARDRALALLAGHGVSITTTETIVFDLLGDAKNPHFKALSAKVKTLLG